jgi:hypothetical protein
MLLPKLAAPVVGVVAVVLLALAAVAYISIQVPRPSQALTKTYSNAAWGFALKMPADFSAHPPNATPARDVTGAPTGQAIVLQDMSGAAVQIVVGIDSREQSSTNTLTADDIEQLAPYHDLSQAEPIQIAPGVIGTTFTETEHPNFGNANEIVWFAYRGNLYEVTADAKDGALFKSIIATWTFI